MNYSDIKDNVQITHPENDVWVVKVVGRIKYFREFLKHCKANGAKYSEEKDGLVFKYDPMDVLHKYEFVYKSKAKKKKVGRKKGSTNKKKTETEKKKDPTFFREDGKIMNINTRVKYRNREGKIVIGIVGNIVEVGGIQKNFFIDGDINEAGIRNIYDIKKDLVEINPKEPKKPDIKDFTAKIKAINYFLSPEQLESLGNIYRGEEKEYAIETVDKLYDIITKMPKTYQTQNVPTQEKILQLHYFSSNSHWYITEKDKGSKDDKELGLEQGSQNQAFGYAILNQDEQNAEWGYISIEQLRQMKFPYAVELDFSWEPITFEYYKAKEKDKEEGIEDKLDINEMKEEVNEMFEGATTAETEEIDETWNLETGEKWMNIFKQNKEKFKLAFPDFNLVPDASGVNTLIIYTGFENFAGKIDLSRDLEINSYSPEHKPMLDEIVEAFIKLEKQEQDPVEILTGGKQEDADAIYNELSQKFKRDGVLYIKLKDGIEITDIKSINKWGTGFYYGFRKGQKNFSKSVSLFDIDLQYISDELEPEKTEIIDLDAGNYKDPEKLNKNIEQLLNKYPDRKPEDWSTEEKRFIIFYSGYGGIKGATGKGILYEYYTPEQIIKKMWGLAYKYGFNGGNVIETSCGIGRFFKYAPKDSEIVGYETNPYSARIAKILYPRARINIIDGEQLDKAYFEQLFIKNNYTIRKKTENLEKFDLNIGNPPYGTMGGKYAGMGEQSYTKAKNYIEYFLIRGLDILKPGGLLIYIIGVEVSGGGKPFLQQGMTKAKEMIQDRADLIDAYRLPNGLFDRTDVLTDIVVFRKKDF